MTVGYNGAVLATEQPEPTCIHVWRDESETSQTCIRCKSTRTITIH